MSYEGRYRETVKGFGDNVGDGQGRGDVQSIAQIIQSIDADLVAFRGCVQSIGTQFDDQHNRSELKRLRGAIKDKLTNAESEIKALRKRGDPQNKIVLDRQTRQLESHISVYSELLEKEKTATKQNPLNHSTASPFDDSSRAVTASPSQSSSQALLGMNDLEQRERDAEELQDLERDILDLHAIQTDMATMVQEQGQDVDRIEVRTEQAQARTEEGLKQTEHAVELKKKNLKLKLIIGGVVAGVIITIVLVIVIVVAAVYGSRN